MRARGTHKHTQPHTNTRMTGGGGGGGYAALGFLMVRLRRPDQCVAVNWLRYNVRRWRRCFVASSSFFVRRFSFSFFSLSLSPFVFSVFLSSIFTTPPYPINSCLRVLKCCASARFAIVLRV